MSKFYDRLRYMPLAYMVPLVIALVLGVAGGIVAVQTSDLPRVNALEDFEPSATTRVFADDGELIAEFFLENRKPVTLDRVPKHVVEAFLAVEDPRFFSHSGIDLIGVARALITNIRARRIVQGGSTITQQLAKILFLEPEKTLSRKLKEAMLALQIEKRYSKEEILTLYLNQVYLGSGAYGIEAASNIYFAKTVGQLTLAEGAMLAGLPRAPSRYSPLKDPERALARRQHVLKRMQDEGFMTAEQMDAASAEPLATASAGYVSPVAPYFVEHVRQQLGERFGTNTLYRGGLNVYTTLDLKMQETAEKAVKDGLAAVAKRHPRKDAEIQGALLALEPSTGYIKALVGGTDFARSQFNRCTQAHRQPGSAFKPILYAAALDKGYRPDDVVLDIPVSYPGSKPGELWRPSNFENDFKGPVSLRQALAKSINVVAVRLLDDVGIPTVINYARRLGIKSDMPPYLPLALGASDVTLLEITAAYAAFDNSGTYIEPTAITRITDREGRVIEEYAPSSQQAVSSATAASLTDMLVSVVRHGTGRKALAIGRPVAGKTGTTSDYNDAWFVGYTPGMALGVWVGYDDHKKIGRLETGSRAALPIWVDFMKEYVAGLDGPVQDFPPPPPPRFANRQGLGLLVDAVGVERYEDNYAADGHDEDDDYDPEAGGAAGAGAAADTTE